MLRGQPVEHHQLASIGVVVVVVAHLSGLTLLKQVACRQNHRRERVADDERATIDDHTAALITVLINQSL